MNDSTSALAKENKSKIKSIENSASKNRIRSEIAGQVSEAVKIGNSSNPQHPTTLHCASLPAHKWHGEGLIQSRLKVETYSNVFFDGAEMDKDICYESVRNMPENATIACCTFDDLLTKPIYRNKSGIASICKENAHEFAETRQYDFAFADYCCNPNIQLLEDTASHIAHALKPTGGLYYSTFSLNTRIAGTRIEVAEKLCKKVGIKVPKGKTDLEILHNAVEAVINQLLKKYRVNTKVEKVYDVIYGGGNSGTTKMMTIGYACYLPKGMLNPIVENRSDAIADLKKKRYATMLRCQKKGFRVIKVKDIKVKKIKIKKSRKLKSKNPVGRPKMKMSTKVRNRLDAGWNDEQILKYFTGLSKGSLGAIKAHYNHPESFKK